MSFSPPRSAPLPSRGWRGPRVPRWALAALLLMGPSLVGGALAASGPASAPGPSRTGGTLQEDIHRLLDRPEPLPRETDWAPLGPEALAALSGLAQDSKAPEPRRARAAAAMAVIAHPEASQRLQELLRRPTTPPSVRAAAVLALGRRAGLEAIPLLAPLLQDPSEAVRAAVAQSLGRVGGAEARRMLEERLPLEERQEVREAIQRGLSYLEP